MEAMPLWGERRGAALPHPGARALAFRRARRRTAQVRVLRVLLPVCGAAALAGFLVAGRLAMPEGLDLTIAHTSITRNAIVMESPRLSGFDRSQREYTISADRAVQLLAEPGQVRLESISALIKLAGHGEARIAAAAGDYDNAAGTLRLSGGIEAASPEGYALAMEDAWIDLRAGRMVTERPVTVHYGGGETVGQRLEVLEGGKLIVLESGVRTRLMPPNRGAASGPAGPTATGGTNR